MFIPYQEKLLIYGTGIMWSFETWGSDKPWNNHMNEIINIEEYHHEIFTGRHVVGYAYPGVIRNLCLGRGFEQTFFNRG